MATTKKPTASKKKSSSQKRSGGLFGGLSPEMKADLISNVTMSRAQLMSQLTDERRDIEAECGYPSHVSASDYRHIYEREGLGTRIIDVIPQETWKCLPCVYETESNEKTEFEKAFDNLMNHVGQNPESFCDDGEYNMIWDYCEKVDIRSGIGHFGVMFLGFSDVMRKEDLSKPVAGVSFTEKEQKIAVNKEGKLRLNFIQVFDESEITVSEYETDTSSPRYRRPKMYTLNVHSFTVGTRGVLSSHPTETLSVHWTRVIHVADNTGSNEDIGVPRLLNLFNRVQDTIKYFAAGGEGYWRGAFPGLAIETQPNMAGDIELDPEDEDGIRREIDDYQHKLQRYLFFLGLSVKSLAPQVVDFSPQFRSVIKYICITLGIPERVFMGAESGELASSQDNKNWRERLIKRRIGHVNVKIIRPLVDRLILTGVLPRPKDKYKIEWEHEASLSERERAAIANQTTEAMVKYIGGGLASFISREDFLVRILGLTNEAAKMIIENQEKAKDDPLAEKATMEIKPPQAQHTPNGEKAKVGDQSGEKSGKGTLSTRTSIRDMGVKGVGDSGANRNGKSNTNM